jgi:periplasmic copper chaperone A
MKKSAIFMAAAMALALAGCGGSGKQEEPGAAGTEQGAPDAKPGITVSNGVLVMPAVKGNPGAAYFILANGGDAIASVAAVSIAGVGRAEMHETRGGAMAPLPELALQPGETARFERGGKHVMAFEIADTVKPGGTAELTLTFAGGDKVSSPLKVETVGGAMAGMDHGDHD